MEENNKKQQPVRITYKIIKKEESPKKLLGDQHINEKSVEEDQNNIVTHKQKRVLVAFIEEQGDDGIWLMCETKEMPGTNKKMLETVKASLWREVATMLNSARVGGCIMSSQDWRKYWLSLMEATKKSVDKLQSKNLHFKLDSVTPLTRRIYKLATGRSEEVSDKSNLNFILDSGVVGGSSLAKELADNINCKDVSECDELISRVTKNQTDFDAIYLDEDAGNGFEIVEEDLDEDSRLEASKSKNIGIVKAGDSRKRKRSADQPQEKDAKTLNTKFESTVNFLRLKQERMKVILLEKEIELRTMETEHKKQIHEAEMKRRQMELVHMDAMHNKILHMSHL